MFKKIKKLKFEITLVLCLLFLSVLVFWGWFFATQPIVFSSPVSRYKTEAVAGEISPEIKNFGIEIDKLEVLAPVVENVDGTKKTVYNKALQNGVAHYKGTALPGQGSNIFIFGHSSSILGRGPYATVFAELNELQKGDEITIYYKNSQYKYAVSGKSVVEKTDLSVLSPTKSERLTLMTCWPIGSNEKRLIIKASLELTK